MASKVDICNAALTKLGAERIASMADTSKQAKALNARFDALRDDELRSRRWQFAIKRTSLAALASAPDHGYLYQYQLPSDFLRLDMVNDAYPVEETGSYIGADDPEWVVEGNRILTDIGAPLLLRYGARIEDVNSWDVIFREVLACRLAAEICEALTQSNSKRELAWKEYGEAIRRAIRAKAIERVPVMLPAGNWELARL